MPDDSKKNQNKRNKSDAKEQRRPRSPRRHSRNQGSQILDRKEKQDPKPEKAGEKPTLQEPGPEFYKNLKRETEEILKISEEAHAKYVKKEIHSNWKKYELPNISYEDIEEQENIGADYEQLIQIPMVTGGHFQFKHEKNWDAIITPSEYDKFFEIDLQYLPIALMSIPFDERNNIDTKVFTPGDISNMKNRANKFKLKYDESKQTKNNNITNDLPSVHRNDCSENVNTTIISILEECKGEEIKEELDVESQNLESANKSINFEFDKLKRFSKNNCPPKEHIYTKDQYDQETFASEVCVSNKMNMCVSLDAPHEILDKSSELSFNLINTQHDLEPRIKDEKKLDIVTKKPNSTESEYTQSAKNEVNVKVIEERTQGTSKSTPIIQSSEDLEKWLDDFLEG